eukprot:8691931-Pyramimonas_sp.AAC.1
MHALPSGAVHLHSNMLNIAGQVAFWIGPSMTLVGNQGRQPPPARKPRRRRQLPRRPERQHSVLTHSQRLRELRPRLDGGWTCKHCLRFARTTSGRKRLALE